MNETKTTRKGKTMTTATPIRCPTGRWMFVGRVSASLAYVQADGRPATVEQLNTARQFGPRLAHVQTRTWATEAEALTALDAQEGGGR